MLPLINLGRISCRSHETSMHVMSWHREMYLGSVGLNPSSATSELDREEQVTSL